MQWKLFKMYVRKVLAIDDMQIGFVPGKCTIDAVYIFLYKKNTWLNKRSFTCAL